MLKFKYRTAKNPIKFSMNRISLLHSYKSQFKVVIYKFNMGEPPSHLTLPHSEIIN